LHFCIYFGFNSSPQLANAECHAVKTNTLNTVQNFSGFWVFIVLGHWDLTSVMYSSCLVDFLTINVVVPFTLSSYLLAMHFVHLSLHWS